MSFIFNTITDVITELQNSPDIIIDELLINPPASETAIEAPKQMDLFFHGDTSTIR